jgi:threonine dehydratase
MILRSPLIAAHGIPGVFLKAENLQPFGSYKIRGIDYLVKHTPSELLKNGLCAASAGNMAQAVAFVARERGLRCKVFLPDSAPEVKKNAIRELGAEIVELPFQEVWALVRGDSKIPCEGIFIHPALTPLLLKGYESLAEEIIDDLPMLDALVVPFGVGGLTTALARVMKRRKPQAKVYACEPETAAPLHFSLLAKRPVSIQRIPSFIDAIGTPEVLPAVFDEISQLVSESLVVSLEQARKAIHWLYSQHHLVCEGASGVSLAAAERLVKNGRHQKVVAVLSGGNISPSELTNGVSIG